MSSNIDRWQDIVTLLGEQVEAFSRSIESRSVIPPSIPEYHSSLRKTGASCEDAVSEFNAQIEPWLSASNGPRYLGFVTGGAHPSAVIGDWIASLYDQNVVTKLDSIASHVETSVTTMLLELFGIDQSYTGTLVSGATMANFVGLACARQWIGEFFGVDAASEGLGALQYKIYAGAPHSSIYKVLSMLGIGRNKLQILPLVTGTEKCDLDALEQALSEHSDIPIVFCASAGTVNLVCFDDLERLAQLKAKYKNLWIHTDAAFGLFVSLLPEHKAKLSGIDCSDSITVDCHKWLNTPYDGAVSYVKDKRYQVSVFKNIAPYLNDPDVETADYLHMAPENSRRFRALPIWFALRCLGRDGVADMIRNCCDRAAEFYDGLQTIEGIRVFNSQPINVVCFCVESGDGDADTKALMSGVSASGVAFMTPTVLDGRVGIRAAFSNYSIAPVDVDKILEFISQSVASNQVGVGQ